MLILNLSVDPTLTLITNIIINTTPNKTTKIIRKILTSALRTLFKYLKVTTFALEIVRL